jgi:RNA polymerase sigma factor (sigma-70 family)
MQQPLASQARPSRAHIEPATRPSRAQIEPATRPTRAQIEPAALALLSRHSAGLLATARRYSASPEDAEDAYQRGVEILLTKAPTTAEDELLPWMKTVVKHEAFAVSKASGRSLASEEPLAHQPDERAWTDQRAERYERLRVGAEAMAALKPQEIRCLLLKAEGLSYQEICQATGFSYTKVNRCLTEGRRAFLKRVAGIEAGAECERLTPLISKLADGEASPEEMRIVRPHLKGCLACKATLREYRAAPGRVAGLVPPVVALTGGGGATAGFLARLLQAVQERFAALGDVAGPKAAALAASAVVLAGGGAAGIDAIHHDAPAVEPAAFAAAEAAPAAPAPTASPAPDPSSAAIEAVSELEHVPSQGPAQDGSRDAAPSEPTSSRPSRPRPSAPQPEFDPGTSTEGSGQPAPQPLEFNATQAPAASIPASGATQTAEPAKRPQSSGSSGAPAGEFGP